MISQEKPQPQLPTCSAYRTPGKVGPVLHFKLITPAPAHLLFVVPGPDVATLPGALRDAAAAALRHTDEACAGGGWLVIFERAFVGCARIQVTRKQSRGHTVTRIELELLAGFGPGENGASLTFDLCAMTAEQLATRIEAALAALAAAEAQKAAA